MQEDFIKKGVIQEEQEGSVIKTASDDLVESSEYKPKPCCGACKCHKKLTERNDNATGSK